MPEPLEGILVVELATGVLGPLAGAYLRDMGADVVKVEPPEGDLTRFVRGKNNGTPPETPGPLWLMGNRGKRSIALDAHGPMGEAVLARLVDRADVLLTNFRPEALAELGLDEKALRSRNPRLVYASGTGWGAEGPDADRMMVDGAAQARGGLSSATGDANGPPSLVGALVADTAGAMQLALGTMTALLARERHGLGQRVDVSALGSQLWLQAWELTHASLTGFESRRAGPHHRNFGSTYGVYETADLQGLFLAQITRDDDWEAICDFAHMPGLATDERWAAPLRRIGLDPGVTADDERALQAGVAAAVRTHTLGEWMSFLSHRPEVIHEPVRSHREVLTDRQVEANGYVVDIDLPGAGRSRVLGPLVNLSVTPGSVKGPPPGVSQHAAEVLAELGFGPGDADALAAETRAAVERRAGSLKFQPPTEEDP